MLKDETIRSIGVTKDNLEQVKNLAMRTLDNKRLTIEEQWNKRTADVMLGFYTTYTDDRNEEYCF